jgi:putative two-component system response regulator
MTPERILCVDDEPVNLFILEDLLGGRYQLITAESGEQALDLLASGGQIDLILLDIVMPGMSGFDLCLRIKSNPTWQDVPVLFLSNLDAPDQEARGLSLGAADFIHKPFSPPVIEARVRNHLQLAAARRALKLRNEDLEAQVAERTREIVRRSEQALAAQSATISALCALAETRDNETGNHIRRTQHYVKALAQRLVDNPRFRHALDEQAIELLFRSAPLHDVGKVAVPDAVLNKPGRLNEEEWRIMRRHPEHGYRVILQAELELGDAEQSFLRYAREIAYGHHEKWDGSGYPQGLSGEAIPLSARLMAVADVYDALISRRVYKGPMSHEQAVGLLLEGRGRHFDPDIIEAFQAVEPTFRAIAQRYCDE